MSCRIEQQSKRRIILSCFEKIARRTELKNKWISLDVWTELIRQSNLTEENNPVNEIVSNLSDSAIKNILTRSHVFAQGNSVCPLGYYYRWARRRKKRKTGNSKAQFVLIQAVLVTDRGNLPPQSNQPWYEALITAMPPNISVPVATTAEADVPVATTPETAPIELTNWFYSTDARKDYGYMHPLNDDDRSKPVEEILIERIRRFYRAAHSSEGWRDLLDDEDRENKMNAYQIYRIQRKALFLYRALTILVRRKRNKERSSNFECCCKEAVKEIQRERQAVIDIIEDDMHSYPCAETMRSWFFNFRKNCYESFPNLCKRRADSEKYPPFLENNPDFRQRILDYARENLKDLSGELLHSYISTVLLPELLTTRRTETGIQDMSMNDLMHENGLSKLTLTTVYNWMSSRLNFKYKPRSHTYYVNGHEYPETVADRKCYIDKYLKTEM